VWQKRRRDQQGRQLRMEIWRLQTQSLPGKLVPWTFAILQPVCFQFEVEFASVGSVRIIRV
jgi:hypothetical protein